MSRLCILLFTLGCLLPACGGLPVLQPAPELSGPGSDTSCRAVFPEGKWQFVHTIEAVLPGGSEKTMMGVTVVDGPARSIDCALMTVEGIVLFSARADTAVRVQRAVPPFDRAGFTDGLLTDLRLMFLLPAAVKTRTGRLAADRFPDGPQTCRYIAGSGAITDVIPGDRWRIYRYSPKGSLARTVAAETARGRAGFPDRLTLHAPGAAGYTLVMTLIDAVRIND